MAKADIAGPARPGAAAHPGGAAATAAKQPA
jgi:hypothetical protein